MKAQALRQWVVLVTFCAGCALGAGFVGSSAAALAFPSPDLPAACLTYNMHHMHKLSNCMDETLKHTAKRNLQHLSKTRQHEHVTLEELSCSGSKRMGPGTQQAAYFGCYRAAMEGAHSDTQRLNAAAQQLLWGRILHGNAHIPARQLAIW